MSEPLSKIILAIALLTTTGCACGDAGQRSCDGFLCLHAICNGEPLTPNEIKHGVKEGQIIKLQ